MSRIFLEPEQIKLAEEMQKREEFPIQDDSLAKSVRNCSEIREESGRTVGKIG
jgi:hypothetical protein